MRKLISAAIICSFLSSPLAFSELKESTDFNPYSAVWKNKDSKEWGDTPLFVKTLVMRISDVYDKDKKDNMVSPFSVIWLQQVLKEPEKYNLTKEDQEWIKTTLVRSAEKGSDQWKPNINEENTDNQNVIVAQSVENKNIVDSEKALPTETTTSSLPVEEKSVKSEGKDDALLNKEIVQNKLENPVVVKNDKKEENISIPKIETTKNDIKEIEKVSKSEDKEKIDKNVVLIKEDGKNSKETHEIIMPVKKVSNVNVKNENQSKIKAILNENTWLPEVIKQLLLIMVGMGLVFYMIFRNKNINVVKGK